MDRGTSVFLQNQSIWGHSKLKIRKSVFVPYFVSSLLQATIPHVSISNYFCSPINSGVSALWNQRILTAKAPGEDAR